MASLFRGKVATRVYAVIITMTVLTDVQACIEQQAADAAAAAAAATEAPTAAPSSSTDPEIVLTPTPTGDAEEPGSEPEHTAEPSEPGHPSHEPSHEPSSAPEPTHTEPPHTEPPFSGYTNDEATQQLVHLYPQLETDGFDPYGCHAYGPVYTMTPDGSQIPPAPSLQGEHDTYNSYHVWVDVNLGARVQYYSCYHTA